MIKKTIEIDWEKTADYHINKYQESQESDLFGSLSVLLTLEVFAFAFLIGVLI